MKRKLGENLYKRIKKLVLAKETFIEEIENFKSFIHCDFRPSNMIVDENNKVYFVDWESASWGHSLADVGQFFRYRSFFNNNNINCFEKSYNSFANNKLPDNWFDLSLFRDLINPLQLLSSNQKAPLRDADLINIINDTLTYWDH